jgi:hypothetical protein
MWRPLGELLLEKGLVSPDELELALAEQAEIDRRHRAGRGQNEELEQDEGLEEDNVVKLEPVAAPRVEVVPDPEPDPDPELERLEAENHRLLDELARLRGEFARLTVAEAPKQASAHLLFVPTPERYLLVEREGAPPARGEELQVFEVEGRFTVTKVGRAPYPGELRPCAYLLRLA